MKMKPNMKCMQISRNHKIMEIYGILNGVNTALQKKKTKAKKRTPLNFTLNKDIRTLEPLFSSRKCISQRCLAPRPKGDPRKEHSAIFLGERRPLIHASHPSPNVRSIHPLSCNDRPTDRVFGKIKKEKRKKKV